jgi:hypothetical protein
MTPFPAIYSYAWSAGHNVALANLTNIETDIGRFNFRMTGGAFTRVAIQTQPVDVFPVRTVLDSGYERGDGVINHALVMTLAKYGVKRVLDAYLSSGTVVSAAMTLYTRRHELDTYARYNCYLILPKPGQDIQYVRENVFTVTWRFMNLVAL